MNPLLETIIILSTAIPGGLFLCVCATGIYRAYRIKRKNRRRSRSMEAYRPRAIRITTARNVPITGSLYTERVITTTTIHESDFQHLNRESGERERETPEQPRYSKPPSYSKCVKKGVVDQPPSYADYMKSTPQYNDLNKSILET